MQFCRLIYPVFIFVLMYSPLIAQSNYAIEFDGIDDRIEMSVNNEYYSAQGYTWEVWVAKLGGPALGDQMVMGYMDNVWGEDFLLFFYGDSLYFRVDGLGGPPAHDYYPLSCCPPGGFKDGEWHHFAGVQDYANDTTTIYLDGIPVAGRKWSRTPITRDLCTRTGFGHLNYDCYTNNRFFKGRIDDFRIWNVVRTRQQIQNTMYDQLSGAEPGLIGYWPLEEGTGLQTSDQTSGANHGTLMDGAKWVTSGIIQPTPPAAPSMLTASPLSPTRMILNWHDNATNESRYVIEQLEGTSWIRVDSSFANTTSTVIENLQPETTYEFRVRAVNPYFASDYSNTASATTPEFVGPSDLVASAFSHAAVILEWKDNSPYETAQIVEKKGSTQAWQVCDTVGRDQTQHYVAGLESSTTYTFRIRALEGTVASPPSNEASATTLLFLDAPDNLAATVLSCTEVRLQWTDHSAEESGFEIEQRIDKEDWSLVHTTGRDETVITLDQLTPRSTYRFRVRAVGDNAASTWSNEAEAFTLVPPATPGDFAADAISHHTVRLTWSRASEDEERFDIERHETGTDWMLAHTVAAGKETIDDEERSASTTYWYRIRAVNAAGPSDWSDAVEVTTPALPVPDTPFGVMARATGPTSIVVTWIMPYPSCEQAFELEESLTGDENDFTAVTPAPEGGDRSYTRGGLQPSTTYYYRLRAINSSGTSAYSDTASATTLKKDARLPAPPFDVRASALSDSRIRISWAMPDPTLAEGFTLERSLSGREDDFTELAGGLAKELRTYVDSMLLAETTYYYRLQAFNVHGTSEYSAIVQATTAKEPLSPELVAAMDAKETLIPALERIFPVRDATLDTLRSMLGSYTMGYDESAARNLLADWRDDQPTGVASSVDAMQRFTLVEQLMADALGNSDVDPPIPGAMAVAQQTMLSSALSVKNFLAMGIAWENERVLLDEDEQRLLDMTMGDLSTAMFDASATLLSLLWQRRPGLSSCLASMHRSGGAVEASAPELLNTLSDYYGERFLADHYLPITQLLIEEFAGEARNRRHSGTSAAAQDVYLAMLDSLRESSTNMQNDFTSYQPICQALDRAYSIHTTETPQLSAFMRKMTVLKPDIFEATWSAVRDMLIPIHSAVYLAFQSGVGTVRPLQPLLLTGARAVFDPSLSLARAEQSPLFKSPRRMVKAAVPDEEFEDDWDMLYAMREKILAQDVDYVRTEFENLRRQGKETITLLDFWQRRIHGVPVWIIAMDEPTGNDYYRVIAGLHRAKARRGVLSVSLADYMLDPQEYKIEPLVAEIDSIIGWMFKAKDDAELKFYEIFMEGWIQLPLLIVNNPALEGRPAEGPKRYELSLRLRNYGPMMAPPTSVHVDIIEGDASFTAPADESIDQLPSEDVHVFLFDVDIEPGEEYLTIATTVNAENNECFTRFHTIPVPDITTRTEPVAAPDEITLLGNHPNPFHADTDIRFALDRPAAVTLTVTDMLGREVRRLRNDAMLGAGRHSVHFDAGALPPGVYLCRLRANGITRTHRMLLLR